MAVSDLFSLADCWPTFLCCQPAMNRSEKIFSSGEEIFDISSTADTERPGEVRLVLPRALLAPRRSQPRVDTGTEAGRHPGIINIPKVTTVMIM